MREIALKIIRGMGQIRTDIEFREITSCPDWVCLAPG